MQGWWKQTFIDLTILLLFITINHPPTFVHIAHIILFIKRIVIRCAENIGTSVARSVGPVLPDLFGQS